MTKVFEKGLMAKRKDNGKWERIVYVDDNTIGLEHFGTCQKDNIEEVSVQGDLRFLDGKLTQEQVKLIESGVIKVMIPQGERYYREDTVLGFGEINKNDRGEYVTDVSRRNGVRVNDGDGDTGSWNWTYRFELVIAGNIDDIIEKQEELEMIDQLDANQLVEVVATESEAVERIEEEMRELQAKLNHRRAVLGKAKNKGRELFQL
tara:strand:+ start:15472 stop:16086 length:615 start_codon:yes stop_codon:yes gene_type:complete